MTDRELLQMALDALEESKKHITDQRRDKTIEALRAALANEFNPDWDRVEALQESLREHMAEIQRLRAALAQPEPWIKTYSGGKPNYTQPEQVVQFKFQEYGPPNWGESQVTKPEFVAEQKAMDEGLRKMVEQEEDYDAIANKQLASLKAAAKVTFEDAVVRAVHKLYNAPPQREWQGLTNEEIENCFEMSMFGTCRAIEAKLKDKNT